MSARPRMNGAGLRRERELAGQVWHDEAWVFATPVGQPINPRVDYDEWKRLLKDAGMPGACWRALFEPGVRLTRRRDCGPRAP
jgi:hypothetical protein